MAESRELERWSRFTEILRQASCDRPRCGVRRGGKVAKESVISTSMKSSNQRHVCTQGNDFASLRQPESYANTFGNRASLHATVLLVGVAFLLWPANAMKDQAPRFTGQKIDRTVAITIDDLPGAVPGSDQAMGSLHDLERWNRGVLQALLQHHVHATGFVIEGKLQVRGERDARAGLLEQWIKAGMELGNHTYTHAHFSDVTIQQFEDDTVRGEVVTRALLRAAGKDEHYFRHPALNTGATPQAKEAFEVFLRSHGYRIGVVTVEGADYEFNDVLADAAAKNDKELAKKIRALYLTHANAMFDYVENASRRLFGREIPQILLIHDNEINSEELRFLLGNLANRGYRFISLDEALTDPAYDKPQQYSRSLGDCYICWGERLRAIGKNSDYPWASTPAWISARFEEIRRTNSN